MISRTLACVFIASNAGSGRLLHLPCHTSSNTCKRSRAPPYPPMRGVCTKTAPFWCASCSGEFTAAVNVLVTVA